MSAIVLDDSPSSRESVTSLIHPSPPPKGEWYGVEAEILANDTLRWYVLYLATLLAILLLYIVSWSPGVEWLEIQWYNGAPDQGIHVGILSGDLTSTTIDSLGWNGAAFSYVDLEEADVACFGVLSESDVCAGLQAKITAAEMYEALLALALVCLTPAILYASWTIHQLRLGLITSTLDGAQVGKFGCVVSNPHAWKEPCTYILPLVLCTAAGVLVGLGTYPITADTMAESYVSLGGLWWGGGQTTFGVQYVVLMTLGYELYLSATLLLPLAIFLGCKCKDMERELRYRGGVDVSGDKTRLSYLMGCLAGTCGRGFSGLMGCIGASDGSGGGGGGGGGGGDSGYFTWWGAGGSASTSSPTPTPSTVGKKGKGSKRARREMKREEVEEELEEERGENDSGDESDGEEETEEEEEEEEEGVETDDEQEGEEEGEVEEEEEEDISYRGGRHKGQPQSSNSSRNNALPPQYVPPKPPPLPASHAFQEGGAFQMTTPITTGGRRGGGKGRGPPSNSSDLDDFSDFTRGFGKG